MSPQSTVSSDQRQRAYDINLQKKLGEVVDMAGRALVAAGLGVGVVSRLAADESPHPGIRPTAIAIFGIVLIYVGVSWQADAAKETPDA
jgi:DNA-binding transcriptional LysR family regulator